jgi:hypothetical protein
MVSNKWNWPLDSAEQIPRVVRCGALAPFAKCALGKRAADARRMVSSRLEISRTIALFPTVNLPGPPLCLESGALPIRLFYNTYASKLQLAGKFEQLNSGLGPVSFFVLDVALGVTVNGVEVFGGERATEFAGLTHEKAARRDDGAFRDKRTGGDDAAGADCGAVEDDAAHANQAAGFDRTAVQDDGVADGDVIAENERIGVAHYVEDGTILDIRARTDTHKVHVTAEYGAGPHAGMFTDDYVTDDHGLGIDVSSCGDLRHVTQVSANHESRK